MNCYCIQSPINSRNSSYTFSLIYMLSSWSYNQSVNFTLYLIVCQRPQAVICWSWLTQDLFPTPCSVTSCWQLTLAMVGVLTPWKLANATIQGFSLPREPLLKHLAAFTVYSVISLSLFIFKSSDYVEQPCRILFPDISFPHLKHSVCHLIYHLPTE